MSALTCPDRTRPTGRGRRLWLAAAVAALTLALAAPALAKQGDSVVGSGSVGDITFSVNAVGAKKPSKPAKGTLFVHLPGGGDVVGKATCVDVQGGLGVVSGRLVAGTTFVDPTATQGFNFYVADGSITLPGFDFLQLELVGSEPAGCTPHFPISPAGVTSGDIVLTEGKSK